MDCATLRLADDRETVTRGKHRVEEDRKERGRCSGSLDEDRPQPGCEEFRGESEQLAWSLV